MGIGRIACVCNIIGYIQENGYETFKERPFCGTDALVLAQLAYVNWDGIVPTTKNAGKGILLKDLLSMRKEHQMIQGSFYGPQNLSLISVCSMSRRFGELLMFGYRHCCRQDIHLQFGALSFRLPDKRICVAFRGTDETLNGWRENFSMVYRFPVPSQEMAAVYLEEIAATNRGKLILTGHSKGGNLAVYAGAKVGRGLQERILRIYNFDGPGFWPDFFREEGYGRMGKKIRKYVVPESLVGLLLKNEGESYMVESEGRGMMQHDPYQWEIAGGKLLKASAGGEQRRLRGEGLNERILKLPKKEAKEMIDSFFDNMKRRGIRDVTALGVEDALAILKGFLEEKRYQKESVLLLGSLVFYFIG